MRRKFLNRVKEQARENPQRIVFPEGFEERVQRATEAILQENTALPVLLGDPDEIWSSIKSHELSISPHQIEIINPKSDERLARYVEAYFEKRKHKGISMENALETVQGINYFGTMMVELDEADGMISGTTFPTADTIRPALQIIKTKEAFHKVSGFFFMILEDRRPLLFADCAIIAEPSAHELCDIALDTAETARRFGITPRIAMLSFSTKGSARHPMVDKVAEAAAMVKHSSPDLIVEGELQVDAALVPEVAKRKFPESELLGNANILIFPDLNSGNIAYKLVERLAGAQAIGPILQGLKKPINDLSRGCSVDDIVNLAAITGVEAQALDYELPFQAT